MAAAVAGAIHGIAFIEHWEMFVFKPCRIHLVAGCVGDDSNVEECEETYISNVQYAADMAKPVTDFAMMLKYTQPSPILSRN